MKVILLILICICPALLADVVVDTSLTALDTGHDLIEEHSGEFPLTLPSAIRKGDGNALIVEGTHTDKGIIFRKESGSGLLSMAFTWSPYALPDDPVLEVVLFMEITAPDNAGNLMCILKSKNEMQAYLQIGGDGGVGLNNPMDPQKTTTRVATINKDQEVALKIRLNYETGETRIAINGEENDTVVQFDPSQRIDQFMILCPHEKAHWEVKFKKILIQTRDS